MDGTHKDKIEVGCEIEVTLKMIGGKCKPLILYLLIDEGTKRFHDLRGQITEISQKTLTNQLRELQADGLISRTSYAEIPPRVEYSITEKGRSLMPVLDEMCARGERNIDDRILLTNPQCGSER